MDTNIFNLYSQTDRLVLADWLAEQGRDAEAATLRSGHPCFDVHGVIRSGAAILSDSVTPEFLTGYLYWPKRHIVYVYTEFTRTAPNSRMPMLGYIARTPCHGPVQHWSTFNGLLAHIRAQPPPLSEGLELLELLTESLYKIWEIRTRETDQH